MPYYPAEVPRHLTYPHRPLFALLEEGARRYPGLDAVSFYGGSLTFRQLDREADRFAQALLALGVQSGERVAIQLPNCPQMFVCLHGALKAGAVATLVNPLYETRELVHQLNDSGARVLVTLSQNAILRKALAAQRQTGISRLIVTSIKDYFPAPLKAAFTLFREKKEGHRASIDAGAGQLWLRPLLRHSPPERTGITVDPAQTAVLQYTGGTTGIPRAAELTHDNLVANAAQARACLPDLKDGRETAIMVLPLFHAYALTCSNLMLSIACRQVLMSRFDLPQIFKVIKNDHPTVFPGIPAMYAAINHSLAHDTDPRRRRDLSSIRVCVSGSDRLPPEVQQEFERLSGGRVVEGYGLTEASPVTHVNPLHGMRKTGSIGLPVPDTEARIVDPDSGLPVPSGAVGELAVRGPQVMKGYWRDPDATAEAISPNGWLKTGDLARVDEDGFYFVVDRKKDIIITGGINVYPREVEDVLMRMDEIREVAVKGIPHGIRGEAVKAYVVLEEGRQATATEIRRFASEQLAAYKVPVKVEFLRELPKSTLRKVLKRQLDADGHPSSEDPAD
ncbi:MAG: long-chain-fatty-acid--CoA ligase [Thermoleophilia bacterium]